MVKKISQIVTYYYKNKLFVYFLLIPIKKSFVEYLLRK